MIYIVFLYLLTLMFIPIKRKRQSLLLSSIPIYLLTIIRYGIGADYESYRFIYNGLINLRFDELIKEFVNIEYPFKLLMYLSGQLGINYHTFNIIISLTILTLLILFISNNLETHKEIVLSMIIIYSAFLFVWSWSALRQGLALSIILLSYYNSKNNGLKKNLLYTFIASLFHLSALINLVYLLSKKISRKTIIIFFVISLISTLIPISRILIPFQGISIVGKLVSYISPVIGFWSFADLTRIVFFFFGILVYDYYVVDDYSKSIMNSFLVGFIIYFFIGFMPIAAGRINIYTLFLISIIIPKIVVRLNSKKFYILATSFFFVFMLKEVKTMVSQTGIVDNNYLISFPSIFNKENIKIDRYFSQYNKYLENKKIELKKFNLEDDRVNKYVTTAVPGDDFVVVFSDVADYYGVLNQDGIKVHEFRYYKPMILQEHYMWQFYTVEGLEKAHLIDLYTNDYVFFENTGIEGNLAYDPDLYNLEYESLSLDSVKFDLSQVFDFPESLQNFKIVNVSSPFEYNILIVEYYGYNVYVYLDEEFNLLIDDYFLGFSLYDVEGFIQLSNPISTETFNYSGERVWNSSKK